MSKTKPFNIPKHLVMQAYKTVKANRGSSGVDQQSLAEFEVRLKSLLTNSAVNRWPDKFSRILR